MTNSVPPFISLPAHLADRAEEMPNKCALRCNTTQLNWAELDDCVTRGAAGLGDLGIGPGSRAAMLTQNSIECVVAFLAILRAGASAVPLSTMITSDAVQLLIDDSQARVLLVSKRYAALAETDGAIHAGALPEQPVALDFHRSGWVSMKELMTQDAAAYHAPTIGPETEFNVIYSSGTTGQPKGIVHRHQMRSMQGTLADLIQVSSESCIYLGVPMYSNWAMSAVTSWLPSGATLVIQEPFSARAFLRNFNASGCTHLFLVPTQITRILEHAHWRPSRPVRPALKLMSGSPTPVEIKQRLLSEWPGGFCEIYGLTEGGPTTLLPGHLYPGKLASVGRPKPGAEIKILNERDEAMSTEEIGEIVGHSYPMMDCYLNNVRATDAIRWCAPDGRSFHRSGDLGYLDKDGFLYVCGRKKDMIISGGANIYPIDIETVLMRHEAIRECAVVGVPSHEWGESPVAFAVAAQTDPPSPADLLLWANARLGKHQKLVDLRYLPSLPRGSLDKILKKRLREIYLQG